MNNSTKAKLKAAGKIALGVFRIASGIVTGTGHGLIGAYCKKHHMIGKAVLLGKAGIEGGGKMLGEGVEDWKKAK